MLVGPALQKRAVEGYHGVMMQGVESVLGRWKAGEVRDVAPDMRLALYSTSKFGLVGYSQALRRDHGDRLGVTALCPRWVATPLLENAGSGRRRPRKRRTQSPEYVAERALEAIRADRSLVVLSPVAKLLWWAHRIHPGLRRRWR